MAAPVVAVAGKKIAAHAASALASKLAQRKQGGSGGSGGGDDDEKQEKGILFFTAIGMLVVLWLVWITSLISALLAGVGQLIPSPTENSRCVIDMGVAWADPGDEYMPITPPQQGEGIGVIVDRQYTMRSDVPQSSGAVYVPIEVRAGHRISSSFGPRAVLFPGMYPFHYGTDYTNGSITSTPVFSAADGVVLNTLWDSGSGNLIYIQHNLGGQNYVTRYAHLSTPHNKYVKAGQVVNAGTQIGIAGSTGTFVTGPHLHFEVRTGAGVQTAHDPQIWLRQYNAKQLSSALIGGPGFILGGDGENYSSEHGGDFGGVAGGAPAGMGPGEWVDGQWIEICQTTGTTVGSQGGAGAWGGHQNGRIPAGELCTPAVGGAGHLLRCDAAAALNELNRAYRGEFGVDISYTDSYRDYNAQVKCRAEKGSLCATPGTSNHGWGLAVDFAGSINSFDTLQHNWMRANAGKYGWVHPSWAQKGGSKPEPWHWEYNGGAGGGSDGGRDPQSAKQIARAQMASYGWGGEDQFVCLNKLWERESNWNYMAANPTSTARGIPQSMMHVHFGSDWRTNARGKEYLENPSVQIKWGLDYINGRYKNPCAAWDHSELKNWY